MNFLAYWQYTDFVTKFLFFILLAMSVLSWTIGILRILNSKKLSNDVTGFIEEKATTMAVDNLEPLVKKNMAEQAMLQEINRIRMNSEKGLSILGTVAAIAPFIGLFGTVWGIFHALHAIGQSGEAGLSQVAGPVGEALIMTALGLAVAIPAVIFYNLCIRINRKAIHLAQDKAHDVIMNQLR